MHEVRNGTIPPFLLHDFVSDTDSECTSRSYFVHRLKSADIDALRLAAFTKDDLFNIQRLSDAYIWFVFTL